MSNIVVCIDPGHIKNYNNGAYSPYYEGNVMWNLAQLLKSEIEKYDGMSAIITRDAIDESCDLATRAQVALDNNAKVLLSLHTNATSTESTCYSIVYRSLQMPNSAALAKLLTEGIASVMKNGNSNTTAHSVATKAYSSTATTTDYYGILRHACGGSVEYAFILEHCFHTNYKQAYYLYQTDNQAILAAKEAAILAEYFGCSLKTTTTATATTTTTTAATVTTTATTATSSNSTSYTVVSGDSWWRIAYRQLGNGNLYKQLAAFNNLSTDSTLAVGQVIKIPTSTSTLTSTTSSTTTYTVKSGDSLWSIAANKLGKGSRYTEICTLNGISSSAYLYAGMVLTIPSA